MLKTERAKDLASLRADFPILRREIAGRPLIYLDSAATSLKPRCVIDAVTRFYTDYTSNVHRAVHTLSEEATEGYEGARETVARFINADAREVAFVRNSTEAINIVAYSMVERGAIAFAVSEHHSNQLPWRWKRPVPLEVTATGEIDLEAARRAIREAKPVLLAVSTVNNALGVRQPYEELAKAGREVGGSILLDVSQCAGHRPIDVQDLDCDFLCFSGHKMLGPSGIGVLYKREDGGCSIDPLMIGGSMVHEVHRESQTYRPFPWCLEAGTPNIEGAIGLAAACDYLNGVGLERIERHCRELAQSTRKRMAAINAVTLVGPPDRADSGIVPFNIRGMEAHGVARILSNRFGILVRSGFHCCQPLHEACNFGETVRASFHLYNTAEEVDRLVEAVDTVGRYL